MHSTYICQGLNSSGYGRMIEKEKGMHFLFGGRREEQPWSTLLLAFQVTLSFPIYQLHLATKTKFLKINILYRTSFLSEEGPVIFHINISTTRFFPISQFETKYCIKLLDHGFGIL